MRRVGWRLARHMECAWCWLTRSQLEERNLVVTTRVFNAFTTTLCVYSSDVRGRETFLVLLPLTSTAFSPFQENLFIVVNLPYYGGNHLLPHYSKLSPETRKRSGMRAECKYKRQEYPIVGGLYEIVVDSQ
ncbi:hypothetical protein FRC18_006012 [Serendipita sp. 400]|nr:hypothetical protein FRC18_006012 [Serendipita sp. 400]